MKLIARLAVILAFAMLVVGATLALHSSRSTTTPAAPSAVVSQTSGSAENAVVRSQSAATENATTNTAANDQTTTVNAPPTGQRLAGGHEEGGSQGWLSVLKNVGVMAGLVVAVDVVNRLLYRVRPRSAASRRAGRSTPHSETGAAA